MNAPQPDLDALLGDVDSLRVAPGTRTREVSREARAALGTAATRALPSLGALTEQIRVRLLESWPEFAQTAGLERELCLTIETNVRRFFGRVVASDSNETLSAPGEALGFAISVQHHGIDTAALIQAYRVGQNIAWSWWMEHLAREVADHELLLEAIERSSERMFAYVDAVVAEQVRMWERERERWSGRLTVQRAEAVRTVIEGEAPGSEKALRSLGYSLERELVAGALWEAPPAAPSQAARRMSRLELTAGAIAGAVGIERTLIVPADASCMWAWFAIDRRFDLDTLVRVAGEQLREGQCLALGIPGSGLEAFRGGHRQALRARRFVELSQAERGVIRFDEVETLCVMSEDPELLADFVERKLGALAARSPGARRLRETLLVWLREGGNVSRAAECLRTHKNTVRNRVQRAEELVGRPLEEDRLGLELALTMVQRVGAHDGAA
ncbi:MAG TPA: helix-turn-helix domain-containing protein [Solirubrobacteraceae bacterium]|nr:helix-turn-helix domain-containing protein [Solirubrobacteraceae bacterium]